MDNFANKVICGNAPEILERFPSESVDCVVTSPPYWVLRDYGIKPQIWDGDENCEHEWKTRTYQIGNRAGNKDRNQPFFTQRHNVNEQYKASMPTADFCLKCQAWRGSLGLEPNFDLYIKHLADIFDEIKRVLRKDGTCWVNLGDTYFGGGNNRGSSEEKLSEKQFSNRGARGQVQTKWNKDYPNKSLCMIPFRFAIEMANRGWILRNTIIWHKRNCMPSSIKDRFTVDFEYVFFFVKSKEYWFEQIFEPHLTDKHRTIGGEKYKEIYNRKKEIGFININSRGRNKRCVWAINDNRRDDLVLKLYEIKKQIRGQSGYQGKSKGQKNWNEALDNAKAFREGLKILQQEESLTDEELGFLKDYVQNHFGSPQGRNKRCVWDIPTKPFKGAHFAVFPETLVEPMIKAGCPEFVCKKCGKARKPIYKSQFRQHSLGATSGQYWRVRNFTGDNTVVNSSVKIGYTKCDCNAGFDGGIVLDPFCGSGTTLFMAKKLGRNYVGIDINPEYIKMSHKRLNNME